MNPQFLPYMVEGEIIKVQKFLKEGKKVIRYLCSALMPNGSRILLSNVEMTTMFGGIGDYMQRRARATTDDNNKIPNELTNDALIPTIGERVLISFIGGSIQYPVIVGYMQHPSQTEEFEDDQTSVDPSAVLQYLGIRVEISDKGDIRFIRKGAPKVKYSGGGLFASVPSLPSTSKIKGNDNKAITPAKDTEVVLWEMLEDGIFRLRDAEGQMFELDRSSKTITLTNDGMKSTEDSASFSSGADSIILDKGANSIEITAQKLLSLISNKDREESTKGDYSHDIVGDFTVDSKGEGNLSALSGITLDAGGAKLKLAKGKVGIGGPGAELLDLIDQQLDAIIQNAPTFVSTSVGPGVLNPAVVSTLTQIKTLLELIKGGI